MILKRLDKLTLIILIFHHHCRSYNDIFNACVCLIWSLMVKKFFIFKLVDTMTADNLKPCRKSVTGPILTTLSTELTRWNISHSWQYSVEMLPLFSGFYIKHLIYYVMILNYVPYGIFVAMHFRWFISIQYLNFQRLHVVVIFSSW